MSDVEPLVQSAIDARAGFFEPRHEAAFRLFNGFLEGAPQLALDLYAKTLVVHDYTDSPTGDEALAREAILWVTKRLPFVEAAVWKVHHSKDEGARGGRQLLGTPAQLARRVREDGVWYALDLTLNRDASLYLDVRGLRSWALTTLKDQRVLNAFAYTGSLGIAARAAGATVLHTDHNRRFLTVAKDSTAMNGWPFHRGDFRTGDFFEVVGALKREGALFDCVFVDPPFRSVTPKGSVDLQTDFLRVLNKVRPLVAHGGALVAVNNALYVPGSTVMAAFDELAKDGYVTFERTIDVGVDFIGTPETRRGQPPADPAPFNHSTKMAILRVRRKDERAANAPATVPAPPPTPPAY